MEWISIKDKLPEINEEVLVMDRDFMDFAYYNSEGQWIDREFIDLDDVTHWMPLPEPPKE